VRSIYSLLSNAISGTMNTLLSAKRFVKNTGNNEMLLYELAQEMIKRYAIEQGWKDVVVIIGEDRFDPDLWAIIAESEKSPGLYIETCIRRNWKNYPVPITRDEIETMVDLIGIVEAWATIYADFENRFGRQ
jgi:hypothetical protein